MCSNNKNNLNFQVHSKGLKFGIYEDIGSATCGGYPGLEGHMKIDAKTLVSWDIDYIKVDGCNAHKHFGVCMYYYQHIPLPYRNKAKTKLHIMSYQVKT